MPAVKAGRVLVTGANGYIAVWVIKYLLEHGFSVRGTVRADNKATHLKRVFKSFGEMLEIDVVEDMSKEGAFDNILADVAAIMHLASPVLLDNTSHPDELIIPALHSTNSLLSSTLKHCDTLKRVLYLSSCATVFNPPLPGVLPERTTTLDERCWNEFSVPYVRKQGQGADGAHVYCASKVLAERAVWDFWNVHKSEVGWDLVVLNPPFVYGPFIHEAASPESLNESARDWYDTVVKGTKDETALALVGFCYIDVRDLALAHVRAITMAEAGGERIVVSAGPYNWQDFVCLGHRWSPTLPAGNMAYDPESAGRFYASDPYKQQRLLGINCRSMEETTKDTLEDLKARDWL